MPLLNLMSIEIELQGLTNGTVTYMEGNIINEGQVSTTSLADRYVFDLLHQTVFILSPDDRIEEVYRLRPLKVASAASRPSPWPGGFPLKWLRMKIMTISS